MSTLGDWILGDLTTSGRIWTALLPAILLAAYFLGGLLPYSIRTLLRGPYRDAELEQRGSSAVLGMGIRRYFAWVTRPFWAFLRGVDLPPAALTTLSVLLAIAGGVALAAGRFALGGWLYIFSGICDFFDGRLARATGRAGKQGAALDSILDRYADTAILAGLAWYYRESWVLIPVLATLVGTFLTSYIRARGEGLGVEVKVGLMQRPERLAVLGAALALSPILAALRAPADLHPTHWLAVGALLFLAVTTQTTAAHRFVFLLRALGGRATPSRPTLARSGMGRTAISAAVATLVDFLVVAGLVSGLGVTAWEATAFGCLVGAIVNFSINRRWAFDAEGHVGPQAMRYAFVSLTSALLNAGGVAVLLLLPFADYRVAWVIARVAVFVAWNFPLQRDYVFEQPHNGLEPESHRAA